MADSVKDLSGLFSSGFAVGVAAFLLLRLEKELRALTKAIDNLRACSVCRFNDKGAGNEV